jgi:hypothetical protein
MRIFKVESLGIDLHASGIEQIRRKANASVESSSLHAEKVEVLSQLSASHFDPGEAQASPEIVIAQVSSLQYRGP